MGPVRSNDRTHTREAHRHPIPLEIILRSVASPRPKSKSKSSSSSISKSKHKRKRSPGLPSNISSNTSVEGEPFAPADDSPSMLSTVQSRLPAPVHDVSPPRRLSMLEVLPVEIIEKIFLYSMNVNLPRASHVVAAALSSERIYRLLILLAFWEDPPVFQKYYPAGHPGTLKHGSPAIKAIFNPIDYVRLHMGERSMIQALVFSCKWCTMDRIIKHIPTLMNLHIQRHWLDEGIEMDATERKNLERFMNRKTDSPTTFNGKGITSTQLIEAIGFTRMEYEKISKFKPETYKMMVIPMIEVQIVHFSLKQILHWPAISVCVFPEKLLRGRETGFTPDDVAFLEMLRVTSANFAHDDMEHDPGTTSMLNRSALHQGVSRAIQTQNYEALISLLKLDEYIFRWHVRNQGEPVFYTIPSEHFEHVIRVFKDKSQLCHKFFEAVLRASAESVPGNSPAIIQWNMDNVQRALRRPTVENLIISRFSQWLSDFMLDLPRQIAYVRQSATRQLFIAGQQNLEDAPGKRFFDEALQPHRVAFKNWLDESSFRNEDHWLVRAGPELSPGFVRCVN
ncbi:hypothetical protein N7520_006002 [Penicillium odoratum]|uniref:uncharacterized protein n=1 Tax=Penicillium odoratum TaxID=1167516 RepID=UPI0025496773|nr:uncharacterized protein N7520_006002 [Penicillium odoratum]KAJ5758846.1 hypothetical protein N7520_006002 [Penicillium odoratum]